VPDLAPKYMWPRRREGVGLEHDDGLGEAGCSTNTEAALAGSIRPPTYGGSPPPLSRETATHRRSPRTGRVRDGKGRRQLPGRLASADAGVVGRDPIWPGWTVRVVHPAHTAPGSCWVGGGREVDLPGPRPVVAVNLLDPSWWIAVLGVAAVPVVLFVETGLLVGYFLPGARGLATVHRRGPDRHRRRLPGTPPAGRRHDRRAARGRARRPVRVVDRPPGRTLAALAPPLGAAARGYGAC
jgi:hypothetical protein